MELNAIEVVERIKSILSAKELEELGIAQSTISNWKNRNTLPKSEDLYKIAQAIGVSMEYFFPFWSVGTGRYTKWSHMLAAAAVRLTARAGSPLTFQACMSLMSHSFTSRVSLLKYSSMTLSAAVRISWKTSPALASKRQHSDRIASVSLFIIN